MPKMGESIMEGTILKWLKKPGEKIERDEPLLEISTDKVDTEVPAPETGIISELLFKEGDIVEVGKVLARMDTDSNGVVEPVNKVAEEKIIAEPVKTDTLINKAEPVKADTLINKAEPVKQTEKEVETSKEEFTAEFYSPLVLNIAKQENIPLSELSSIKGSGQNNRVTKKDILDYVKNRSSAKQAGPASETVSQIKKTAELPKQNINFDEEGLSVLEFDNIRQKMAEHMVASMGISPHVNAIAEVDLSRIEKIRAKMKDEFEDKEGFKITYMPFIAEATIKALKDFPLVNSIIDDSVVPFKAISRSRINLGIAVAMDNGGLIVPVIHNADGKNLVGLARDMNDLGKRARIKKLTLDEIQGGTFTISNYGVFGNIIGTMIINQPQVAILGIGAVKKRPAVLETPDGDFVVIRPMVYLTLSFDHRLIDGALGGKFVMRVAHYLENYQG
jgi:2-oxoglutarate dehydrogenase E2 component (dihydrolipoamide succinyltransferase)